MKDTRFQIGNQFWKLAPKTGRKPKYDSAEQLEQDCYDYIEATINRRDWDKQNWVGKDGEEVTINIPTPFTKTGLWLFLGVDYPFYIFFFSKIVYFLLFMLKGV